MQEYSNLNDGDLNPDVQLELEKLNTASAQINELENKIQELRNVYYESLSKCTAHLTELSNKIGNVVIARVRPYFDLKRQQIEIQKESQIAATRYETACVQMSHADAVVSKSETLASESSKLDDSTMEILNIAISKVNLSKIKKNEAHKEHQYYLNLYREIDEKIHQLERRHKNDIKKAKAYFHYSKYMDEKLKDDKLNIEVYEDKVRICKLIYNEALQRLEDISNKIHLDRKNNDILGPRGEGVGAEVDSIEHHEYFPYIEKSESSDLNTYTDDSSLTTTSTFRKLSHNSHPNRRKPTLLSATPIVNGLLEAASSNYYSTFSKSEDKLNFNLSQPYSCQKRKSEINFDGTEKLSNSSVNAKGDCLK